MAKTLSSKFTIIMTALYEQLVGIQDQQGRIDKNQAVSLASGTGANQADLCYVAQPTIAASGTLTVDLAGALTDMFGATLTFARIKAILVLAAAGNTNNVLVGGAGANAFLGPLGSSTDVLNVRPGGMALVVAPDVTAWPVTAATADLLKFANSGAGTGVTFDLAIIGASA